MDDARRRELRARLRSKIEAGRAPGGVAELAQRMKSDPTGTLLGLGVDDAAVLGMAPQLVTQSQRVLGGMRSARQRRRAPRDAPPDGSDDEAPLGAGSAEEAPPGSDEEAPPDSDKEAPPDSDEAPPPDSDKEAPPDSDEEAPPDEAPPAEAGAGPLDALDRALAAVDEGQAARLPTRDAIEGVLDAMGDAPCGLVHVGPATARWLIVAASRADGPLHGHETVDAFARLGERATRSMRRVRLGGVEVGPQHAVVDDARLGRQALEALLPSSVVHLATAKAQPHGFRLVSRLSVAARGGGAVELKLCRRAPAGGKAPREKNRHESVK